MITRLPRNVEIEFNHVNAGGPGERMTWKVLRDGERVGLIERTGTAVAYVSRRYFSGGYMDSKTVGSFASALSHASGILFPRGMRDLVAIDA